MSPIDYQAWPLLDVTKGPTTSLLFLENAHQGRDFGRPGGGGVQEHKVEGENTWGRLPFQYPFIPSSFPIKVIA